MSQILPRLERYHRPTQIDEATAILREHGSSAMLLGGGVSLGMIPRPHIRDVVCVERLGLDTVRRADGVVSVGAAVTLSRLDGVLDMASPAERLLRMTIRRTATTPLRNLITMGGVIGGMGPWSDLPVSLLALGAEAVVDGIDALSMEQCAAEGPKRLAGRVITEVRIPGAGVRGGAFIKIGRNETDLAMASAAVVQRDGEPRICVAVGGFVPRPVRVPAAEEHLRGPSPSRDAIIEVLGSTLKPRVDPRADADYRVVLAAACVMDCFAASREEARR